MTYLSAESSIIQRPDALKEEYVPEQILHRMDQLQEVAGAVEPLLQDRTPRTVLMHGPSGAGKTTLSRFFLRQVEEQDPQVRTAAVNCWDEYSQFDVLQALIRELGVTLVRGKISRKELQFKLEQLCGKRRCVFVLDEVDQLEGKKLLYTLGQQDVGLILISNDATALYQLDERVKSRLGPIERVQFPAYNQSEMEDIVESRARHALTPQSITKGQLRRIAAASGGNAHLAIESLRLAAERADSSDSGSVTDEHLKKALKAARQTVRSKSLERLNPEQRLLYQIVKDRGEMAAGELHEVYRERSESPVTERAVRNYLQKLYRYGFIRVQGVGRWRKYSCNS